MEQPFSTGCLHLIRDVALLKVEIGYLVECHGCLTQLGFVATPRDFQALRRAVMAMANPSTREEPNVSKGRIPVMNAASEPQQGGGGFMYQTVYPERRTRERHPRAEEAHSVDAFPPREASGNRRVHHAPTSGDPVDGVVNLFERLPGWAVLAALWLLGAAVLGSGVLVLYVLAALGATVVG